MIKIMLKPFLKKYLGLFISMAFVSLLSIGLLSAFSSTVSNLRKTYKNYINQYENIDSVIKIGLTEKESLSDINSVKGLNQVEFRLTLDAKLLKNDGRVITSRIFTFNDNPDSILTPYVLESIEPSNKYVNVSILRKFAVNNGYKVGDTIKIGYFNTYLDFYINQIVETPEGIQARANDYVWSDNTDFGYVYVKEAELDTALMNLSIIINDKINNNPEYKEYYKKVVNITGHDFPDLANTLIESGYTHKFTNQLLIRADENISSDEINENVTKYLEDNSIKVKSATPIHQMFYIIYIDHAIEQLQVAAIFLPVFFYAVTMIVIGLFINQIIKSMTPQIGVMMLIGVGKKDIVSIFMVYTLLMSLVASVLGIGVGQLLNGLLAKVMINVYSMPTIPTGLSPLLALLSGLSLILFSEITTMISCQRIFKITPKDATISNEAKRKKVGPFLSKIIDKSPMNIKLGLNSIAQNPRRFFVSTFSIFASFVIILLSMFFYVSKTELMDQTINRRLNFDAQVYLTEKASEEQIQNVKNISSITAIENCLYTYAEATSKNNNQSVYLELLALDANSNNNLVNIPNEKGVKTLKLNKDGIIIPKGAAKQLNVKVGDYITINQKDVLITGISFQYFHPITFLSLEQMEELDISCVTSFLINTNNEIKFLDEINNVEPASLTVFTKALSKDIGGIFNSINVFIIIMIGFSLGMGFIILSIMSQNALMEQQRQLSIFRAIGFKMLDISNLWTLQSVAQLIISSIIAIPVGVLVSNILFKMCSSASQTYPFIFSIPVVLFAFGFILIIIIVSHLLAMFKIKKWNIADNTRTRE